MEEDPACCVLAGGAMSKLAAKLDGIMIRSQGRRRHMPIPWEVKNELIPLIKQNLGIMMEIIQDGGDENSSRAVIRCLTKEVRELSYDIHDCVDEHAAGPASDHVTRLLWRMERHVRVAKANDKRRGSTVIARRRTSSKPKPTWLSERLKGRLWLLDKMREFSARSEEALRRYNSFNRPVKKQRNEDNHGDSSTSGKSTRSGQSFGSWSRPPNTHVLHRRAGIHDLAMNTLKAWLTDGDSPKLKVVSMVGCGGLGKTTLANELYREIRGQYECRAFVRTSQKPDVRRLLISIISQIRPQEPPGNWKVHNLIGDIRTHLQDKRYLIVIDDVWARSTWDILHRAFPDGNHYSRILITSELEDVALKCCGYEPQYVYKMKLPSEDDSRKLFYSIVVCPQELSVVSNSIIRKCGGLPLAIVTVASLLASRMGKPEQREYVEYVDKSLGYGLMTNLTLEGMKQVVNLSYRNLPQHLKACMLYLCIFPEGYIIWRDALVNQWIAEGFICATDGKDEEEISRGYFDELISSRLIHPIHIDGNDKVLSCTMHHVMRNHIMQESIVENFVAAIDYSQAATRFAHKVRRLSLNFGNAEDATLSTNMRLSQVRTLAFFGAFKCVPSITGFRLLQVLILHFWGEEESIKFDLTSISEIFRLRYLQVTCNVKLEIQEMQMLRRLQCLETLTIEAARGSIIPSDIVHIPRLLHLRLPAETNLLSGLGHMTSLRTLGHFDLSTNSIDKVRDLGKLTNVQDLHLTCTLSVGPSRYLVEKMECLSSVLGKLNNLKCITLKRSRVVDLGCQPSSMIISCDVLSSVSSPPALLERLEWLPRVCTFSSLPEWIGHLGKLCILKVGVRELVRNDVDLLKGLPALTVLSLYVHTKPAEIIVFAKGGFLVLKYFRFRCSVPCLKFEADVMPNLRKLKLGFDAHGTTQYGPIPAGLDHLSGLEEISAKIGGASASGPVRRIVESALSDAIRMHAVRPTVNMQCVNQMFGDKDDQNIRLQEEKEMTPQESIEEDSNEQHVTLQKGSREDAASRTASGTFKDGELRLNQRGLQLISEENGDELQSTHIKVEDVQLSMDDLEMIQVIGKGSGGVVQLVQHKWVGTFYALKGIQMNIQEAVRKQIVQELKINQATQSPHIVSCHQSFYHNGVIYLVLEYMDRGSLADIIKQVKTILEPYLAVLCKQVLEGLLYLHRERHVIHRDIKPSNLLVNHKGEVKITDFGVSAVLAGSIGQRDTFVGTYNYMAPERISGSSYDYKSDVWSLGLVILECAIGRFPYIPPEGEGWLSFYELLEAIVDQPPPSAPADQFSPEFCSFISSCIQKDPAERMSASELLNHAFIKKFEGQDLDLKILVESLEPPMNVPE